MPLHRRHHAERFVRVFAGLVLGFGVEGCSDDTVPVEGIAHPTLVQVSPEDFLGSVPCVDAPGAMRRYVATVFAISAEDADDDGAAGAESETKGFALPSSTVERGDGRAMPTPCTQSVGFSHIVQNDRYWAEIDGYDRDDLVALAPGTRLLYDPLTSERVEPRWKTSCSKDAPVPGVAYVTRAISSCEELEDSAPAGEAIVEVRVDDALGMLECGSAAGAVDRFEVTPPNGAPLGAVCGETVPLPGLDPSAAALTLPLQAFEAGASEPTWGTSCVADVIAGVTTTATCYPLSSKGALEVDPLDALTALGLECDAQAFAELEVETVETTDIEPDKRYVDAGDCARPLNFQNREPGVTTARASVRFADGTRSGVALCSGTIIPGSTVRAVCAVEP